MIPAWRPTPPGIHRRDGPDPSAAAQQVANDDPLVRPFLLTGGRTRPARTDLRIETLVWAGPQSLLLPLQLEPRAIVEMCQVPLSIAEVAVRLAAPLGVARVLVGDLLASGHLQMPPQSDIAIDLLERIRDRVRAL